MKLANCEDAAAERQCELGLCSDCGGRGGFLQSKACVEYVSELLDAPDAKHLVFAHHTVMMDAIETLLRKCAPSPPPRQMHAYVHAHNA